MATAVSILQDVTSLAKVKYIFDKLSSTCIQSSRRIKKVCLDCLAPIWININLFIGCLFETRNYSILSLAFIASLFRVTEENLVFENVQSGPYSSLECFL